MKVYLVKVNVFIAAVTLLGLFFSATANANLVELHQSYLEPAESTLQFQDASLLLQDSLNLGKEPTAEILLDENTQLLEIPLRPRALSPAAFPTPLDQTSAIANQATYDQLKALGCQDESRVGTADCEGVTFIVWNNVRALVHTSNQLLGSPTESTTFSLDIDAVALNQALRWTSSEELAAQDTMTDNFVTGQHSSLSYRLSALRYGTKGFMLNSNSNKTNKKLSSHQSARPTGINAGDETGEAWSRLGGFLDVNYTYGDQRASEYENAFDMHGYEISTGLDYRLDDHWVVGGILGYISETVDFDPERSVSDGTVDMDGLSLTPFVLYQTGDWFYSASAAYQKVEFNTDRNIRYLSNNASVASIDTVAKSNNNSDSLSASLSGGNSYFVTDNLVIEQSVSLNYRDVSIDEIEETDINNDGFNLLVKERSFQSFESVVGVKMQYTLSNQYGVFMPYIDTQYYAEHKGGRRYIDAVYADVSDELTQDAHFILQTNTVDSDYKIYGLGVAAVIRGAQQTTLDSAANGGIQAYINVREIKDVGGYSQKIFSAGMRYEL